MLTRMMELFRSEKGQGLAEYALILVLISIAAIATMTILGTDISAVFTTISGSI